MFGFGHPEPDPDREQVALREDVLAGVLHGADHDDAGGAALGQQQRRGRSRSAACMVRSLTQPVSAASSSMISTISGSAADGVWSRVTPRSRSWRVPHHRDGVLEQLRRGRFRSRRRRWRRRGRTGRTGAGRGRVPCRLWGRPPTPSPTPSAMWSTRPAMIDQITDALPAPVAPTIRTWLPTSGSRHTVPSSASATGMPAVEAVRVGRERRHDVCRAGRGSAATAAPGAAGCGMERTRQSAAPKVWASRSATSA